MKHVLGGLLAVVLLVGCQLTTDPDLDGRYPVEMIVVGVGKVGGDRAARVTAPTTFIIEDRWATHVGLVAHELCHIVQWNEMGYTAFLLEYSRQWRKYGYDDMPLELECYELENDPWYRAWAKDVIAAHQ